MWGLFYCMNHLNVASDDIAFAGPVVRKKISFCVAYCIVVQAFLLWTSSSFSMEEHPVNGHSKTSGVRSVKA